MTAPDPVGPVAFTVFGPMADTGGRVRAADGGVLAAIQPARAVARRHRIRPATRIHTRPGPVLVLDDPDPASVLDALGRRGALHVWLEGGPHLAAAFVRVGLIDQVIAYLAPRLVGAGLPILASQAEDIDRSASTTNPGTEPVGPAGMAGRAGLGGLGGLGGLDGLDGLDGLYGRGEFGGPGR